MEQTITGLLTTLLGYFLPIGDMSVRIAVSVALSQICSTILKAMIEQSSTYWDKWIFKKMYKVSIHPSNPSHEKLMKYYATRHATKISNYILENDRGSNKLIPLEFVRNSLTDTYDDQVHQTHQLSISLGTVDTKQPADKNSPVKTTDRIIHIESKSAIKFIEEYVQKICTDIGNIQCNKIPIYRTHVVERKDYKETKWKSTVAKLSKNTSNTIVSKQVKNLFYDDIATFMKSEEFYLKKGLPYKRGYLLHGHPGCGKTSLIKAIANEYSMPIFIIDLSTIDNNAEFIKITSEINTFINQDQPYVVVYEDLDRSNMFKKWGRSNITKDCFLNILDGLDEYHGRITIITANDVERITETKALVRPGRIDVIIELPKCGPEQIKDILKFYFETEPTVELLDGVEISPAQLTQIILSIKDIDRIIKLLNKYKKLSDANIVEVASIYADDNLDVNMELISPPEDEVSEEEKKLTPVETYNEQIAKWTHKIAEIKIKLGMFDKPELSDTDNIKRDRLLIALKLADGKITQLQNKRDICQYKQDNNVDTKKTKRGRSRRSG